MAGNPKLLLSWYENLSSRQVDLVGDYAGNELFVVHGESLLLHCFDTDEIDFDGGLQLLHAVHAVEAFLYGLVQRKCNFHITFINEHESLCIPTRARSENHHKYRLARAVIIRHLQVHLPKTHPRVQVNVFEALQVPELTEYLESSGVYFIMCHDGALSVSPTAKAVDDDSEDESSSEEESDDEVQLDKNLQHRKSVLRAMIYWFIQRGHYIALINGLQWHDTKVITMVLEGAGRTKEATKESLEKIIGKILEPTAASHGTEVVTPSDISEQGIKSESQLLMVHVLRDLLSSGQISRQLATALVLQAAILKHVPLSQRRINLANCELLDNSSLELITTRACDLLRSTAWSKGLDDSVATDIADFIDGRVLRQLLHKLEKSDDLGMSDPAIIATIEGMKHAIETTVGAQLGAVTTDGKSSTNDKGSKSRPRNVKTLNLLPFNNAVFDRHLESVRVTVDDSAEDLSNARARVFEDLTHWHSIKPVVQRVVLSEKDKQRANRSNQFFMREMTQYAASLTNAVGKILEPETIITGQPTQSEVVPATGKRAKIAEENAATIARKNEKKFVDAWKTQTKEFDQISELDKRFLRAKTFFDGLSGEKRAFLEPEVELYLLNTLLNMWSSVCRAGKQSSSPQTAAMIYDLIVRLGQDKRITPTMQTKLEFTSQSLGLPLPKTTAPTTEDRPLSFKYLLAKADPSFKIAESACDFQLSHCGPYFDRSIGSTDDDRVRFKPDAWQKKVLDVLDQEKSVFVVAPTSAGKTFISFYAMKQILKADDNSVLVYVAPTKALVNQIAAELQANFSKKFKHGGKSVWAIHTRDYRVNNPTGCQVLVTVPHILQIMLMSPANARSWAPRVKRIIFDEIHSIGQADDGIVWEQLLLLAPCPIIALSATVGNPEEFNDWLVTTQKSLGFEMVMIAHPHRYSDLRKYIYQPPKKFVFERFASQDTIGIPSLDGAPAFAHMHPIAALINESRGVPEDLHLEPADCLTLWRSMTKHANAKYPVDASLDPASALPKIIRKVDVIHWEAALKGLLKKWMGDPASPYKLVISELSKSIHEPSRQSEPPTSAVTDRIQKIDQFDLTSTTLPLLSALNAQNALPAILFNYDRSKCENICSTLLNQLVSEEKYWKETSPIWKEKLAAWERWKVVEAKKPKKSATKAKKKGSKDDDDERTSKTEAARDSAEGDASPFAKFNPDEPIDGFHFADNKKRPDFEDVFYKLRKRHVPEWLLSALTRGIAVHHAGMNRAYRQEVERLFRGGFLRVVVATGTLALGINMPCRTVVFSGDSVFLTALNYRQAAGRAGRRGFDLLGSVVFQSIPLDKVCRLVSSRLPDLNGHFPITTSLVLRLFILLHESKNSRYAENAIESLLSQPRLYLGGPSFKDQVLHHLRFSIEYLRRQHLLSRNGTPLNFAGCVSHLYYTEQSSFAFHALLKDGYFHNLCAGMTKKNEDRTLDKLMLVLSHLFGRRWCRQADQEFKEKIRRSPSMIFLPDLPNQAKLILREHNQETLQVFTAYVKTFAAQHLPPDDRKLPLTGMLIGSEKATDSAGIDSFPPTSVRSAFVALSGYDDEFNSINELCRTARDGVFLEESVIPSVTLYPEESNTPLNAYLYDYYRHGDLRALAEDNGIRAGEVWFLLNDFSMVLATIVTSLRNYMNLGEATDADLLDTAGGGDLHEVEEDDRMAEDEVVPDTPRDASRPITQPKLLPTRLAVAKTVEKKKKKVVIDSWDDEDVGEEEGEEDEGDDEATLAEGMSEGAGSVGGSTLPAWEEDSGESLRRVLRMFERLKVAFDEKFRAMWA